MTRQTKVNSSDNAFGPNVLKRGGSRQDVVEIHLRLVVQLVVAGVVSGTVTGLVGGGLGHGVDCKLCFIAFCVTWDVGASQLLHTSFARKLPQKFAYFGISLVLFGLLEFFGGQWWVGWVGGWGSGSSSDGSSSGALWFFEVRFRGLL